MPPARAHMWEGVSEHTHLYSEGPPSRAREVAWQELAAGKIGALLLLTIVLQHLNTHILRARL